MLIGLTYDLRSDYLAEGYSAEETAEFDSPITIDALQRALTHHGHSVERIGNVRALTRALAAERRWDLVFNIAEGLRGFGREAQIPALLEAHSIACTFSDTLVMSLCLHKGFTKDVLRARGIPTPASATIEDAAQCAQLELTAPLFVKPIAEGTGKGVSAEGIVRRLEDLPGVCERLIARYHQAVLVESYLDGREFTVGILGTGAQARALGALEVVLKADAEPGVYSYENKERCEQLVEYRLATDATARRAEAVALAAWRCIGGRDVGRIDLRCDASGAPHLLEINPIPGMHPSHSDLPMLCTRLGMGYEELVGAIVQSACERTDVANVRSAA